MERLRERGLGAPAPLADVDWRLHLRLSQSDAARINTPAALFEFGTSATDGQVRLPFLLL